MAQHDYTIADQPGLAFRTDLNEVLAAIVSQNSGTTEPEQTFAFQWWADTTSGILKQRNAGNNAWNDVLDLTTGRPTGAVAQTSATGAVLLPEGDDSERPSPIPDDAAVLRGSNQDPADYKLEFWNRVSATWQGLASRPWVQSLINLLASRVETLEDTPRVRALVKFDGTGATPTILASYNVSGITDHGAGDYTVTFSSSLSSAGYAVSATCTQVPTSSVNLSVGLAEGSLPTATSCRLRVRSAAGTQTDSNNVHFMAVM